MRFGLQEVSRNSRTTDDESQVLMHCRLEPYDVIRWVERFPAAGGAREDRVVLHGYAVLLGPDHPAVFFGSIEPGLRLTAGPGRMRQTFNVGQDSHIGPLVSF